MSDLMSEDQFWAVIDIGLKAREGKGPDERYDAHADAIREQLVTMTPNDICKFDNRLSSFMDELYRWDVWGAAYLANGGCSDDGFLDFRYDVIGEGRELFYKTLENPDNLGDYSYSIFGAEVFNYVVPEAYEAYAAKTGQPVVVEDLPSYAVTLPPNEPKGEDFDFDDDELMAKRYPKIMKRVEEDGWG